MSTLLVTGAQLLASKDGYLEEFKTGCFKVHPDSSFTDSLQVNLYLGDPALSKPELFQEFRLFLKVVFAPGDFWGAHQHSDRLSYLAITSFTLGRLNFMVKV